MKNTILIWHSALTHIGKFSPIFGNEDFQPGRADQGFKRWAIKGIAKVSDLHKGNKLMSFEELRVAYDISTKHFFQISPITKFYNI